MKEIAYRRLQPSEIPAACTLAREVFDQFVASEYPPEGVDEFHRYASVEAMSRRQESGHVTMVAVSGGQMVGMLHLREPRHVAMLFVRPSFQRRGVGRGLLAAAAVAGGSEAGFTVHSSLNAVPAYLRLGFVVVGPEQCVHGIRFVPMQRLSNDDRSA